MNLVSEIGAQKTDRDDEDDIILGEDWEKDERGEFTFEDAPRGPRNWIALNSSPLARKIITFNLLALVVLVGGVLYLSQSRDGLVVQRENTLLSEARLMAKVFEAELPKTGPVNMAAGDGISPDETLRRLELSKHVEVFIFDAGQKIVASSLGSSQASSIKLPARTRKSNSNFITGFLNSTWEWVATLFSGDTQQVVDKTTRELAEQMAAHGLAGNTKGTTFTDSQGDLVFSVATPISRDGQVIGVLVLTTISGDINDILRTEREQVLQMFVVALLVSIGLSLVLASTIANPLRDLAMAAEFGKAKNARKMSPGRIRIPDMTARPDEIGRLSGALRGMIAALYDRIDANEQFAADVAHEIKNPLSSLRSAVDTMRVARNDVQRERLLQVIEHDVRRLDRLVSDISNASRLDSELVKEEMEAFDLVNLLENLISFNRIEAQDKGIELISDMPPEPIILRGLEARLAQVFVNLLTNAMSFCEDGDAVRIWTRRRENRVLVVVEDTGPGIPEQALAKIFSRFYSERPASDFGNHSGLGLAISRQIVEAHGGVIWAENIRPTEADVTSEPLGARFVVGLPV
ncbi:MAG: sensor histidine kinase [Rhodobacter sp.]|jgi:two-component system, OmpR family, sensor histidine kinase ChvG|nr:sensor histidine kinase [Rhodobacter sp.]